MTFLHAYMLGGLALLGVPIVVHLIMRQKPRRLPFPAFRFLRQRSLVNRRRLRLQHLLLLLLRMLALAALCLALSQPRLFLPRAWADRLGLGGGRPTAVAFVFDVSHSMEYKAEGVSRLDDARRLALERLHDLPDGARVAVLDTGEDEAAGEAGDEWIDTPEQVRARVNGLRLRPVKAPLVRQLGRAFGLLADVKPDGGDAPDRRVYVFSDRTKSSWDAEEAKRLAAPAGVDVTYVDVGVDAPRDLSIDEVKVEPQVVPPGGRVQVRAEVRATGADFDAALLCQYDDKTEARKVHLAAGQSKEFVFDLAAPPAGSAGGAAVQSARQVVVKLTTPDDRPLTPKDDDGLAHDNARFATFLVRDDPRRVGRKVLALADRPKDALFWWAALKSYAQYHPADGFECEVIDLEKAKGFDAKTLGSYRVVCLFQTADPLPGSFGDALERYVREGGGLVLVPPGDDALKEDDLAPWNGPLAAHHLLPAKLTQRVTAPAGGYTWETLDPGRSHDILRPFIDWKQRGLQADLLEEETRPLFNRFWRAEPVDNASRVIVSYADDREPPSPALVERPCDKGRVVEFTTVLDGREAERNRPWQTYYLSSFGIVLTQRVCAYLAGDSAGEQLNYPCGETASLTLPAGAPRGVYHLDAPDPDLTESQRNPAVERGDAAVEVRASAPGNYTLFDPDRNRVAAFSLNVRPEEARLDRLPAEAVTAVLGKDALLTGGDLAGALRERDRGRAERDTAPARVDPLPLVMVLVLAFLTLEGVLANRFYRRPAAGAGQPVG
jgi:hypothetical protein